MDETPLFILFLLGMIKTGVVCAESVCGVSSLENKMCEYGCCGDAGSQYCCFYWKGYVVIGSVVGGLILMPCIVGAIIVFSCYSPVNTKTTEEEAPESTGNKCQHVRIPIDGAPNLGSLSSGCSPSAHEQYVHGASQTLDPSTLKVITKCVEFH